MTRLNFMKIDKRRDDRYFEKFCQFFRREDSIE